jgi:hypothetical protein
MSNYDEDPSIYNGLSEVEVVIDRPVAQVWNQFLDIGSWVTSHVIETVCGTVGTLGSIMRVSFKGATDLSMPPPHHHFCKVIEVIPERQYVLKTYSARDGSYGLRFSSFDDSRFFARNGGTRLTFALFAEFRGERASHDALARSVDVGREGMLKNLGNLKRMMEGH